MLNESVDQPRVPPPGLEKWNVLHIEDDGAGLTITVEVPYVTSACAKCDRIGFLSRRGTKRQAFTDRPWNGKRVHLVVVRRRFACAGCGSTFLESLAGCGIDERSHRRITRRLATYIEEEGLRRPYARIAADVGLAETTIASVFEEHMGRLDMSIPALTPSVLGLSAVQLAGSERCLVTNVWEQTLIDVLPSTDADVVAQRLQTLQRKYIDRVYMPIHDALRDAVRMVLPDVRIIVDHASIMRLVDMATDQATKALAKCATAHQRRTYFKDAKRVFAVRPDFESDDVNEAVSRWERFVPALARVHTIRNQLYYIWLDPDDTKHRRLTDEEALKEYGLACFDIELSLPSGAQAAYVAMRNQIDAWRSDIFDSHNHPVHDSYPPSLNHLLKGLANVRSISFPTVRANLLYSPGLRKTAESPSRVQMDTLEVQLPDGTTQLGYYVPAKNWVRLTAPLLNDFMSYPGADPRPRRKQPSGASIPVLAERLADGNL